MCLEFKLAKKAEVLNPKIFCNAFNAYKKSIHPLKVLVQQLFIFVLSAEGCKSESKETKEENDPQPSTSKSSDKKHKKKVNWTDMYVEEVFFV